MSAPIDGFGRPDVRVQLETDDGVFILLSYTGLVELTETFKKAAASNTETQWNDQYMRMVMVFETGAQHYAWLNQFIFIAEGRILNKNEIEYKIYRVT